MKLVVHMQQFNTENMNYVLKNFWKSMSYYIIQPKGESEELCESGEYNVYSTFQSHEPDFDYLKSLEIEEKINKIRWLPQQNAAHFLLSTNGNL